MEWNDLSQCYSYNSLYFIVKSERLTVIPRAKLIINYHNNVDRLWLREGTVKSGSTIYPRLCSGPRSQIISSFICHLLGFQNRASRGCSPQFFKKGNFDQNYQKIIEKLKCRGPVSTFLARVDPRYIRSIDVLRE